MPIWLIVVLVIWGIITFSGILGGFSNDEEDSTFYAKCLFWPVFLSIWLGKGAIQAFKDSIK